MRVKDSTTRAVAALVVLALLLAGAGLAFSFLGEDDDRGTQPGGPPTAVEVTPEPGSTEAPEPDLAIDWPVASPLLSDKDAKLPFLADIAPGRLPPCIA